jgi:hypothetical protein
VKLLPSVVMTFPSPDPCPWCEAECEWRCLDDGEFVWRLFCVECGAELEGDHDTGLL